MLLTTRDSAELNYTCFSAAEDAAETILFVHGMGLDQTTWDWITPYLRSRYHIVTYDMRGHGKSGTGTEELSWDLLCEDMHQLISILNITKLHLVGHGFGGNLCLQFALRYPSLVESIVLIGTACYYPKGIIQKHISNRRRLANGNDVMPLARELVKKICHPLDQRKQDLLLQAYEKVKASTYFAYMDLATNFLTTQIVSCIHTPVLLLAGQLDPTYPPNLLIMGASFLPRAQFLVVPSSSNCIQLDQPMLAVEWMDQFFSQLDGHSGTDLRSADWTERLSSELQGEIQQVIAQGYKKINAVSELRIELVHTFRVLVNGEEVPGSWNQRHAKEIIAYLAVHKTATREQMCDLYWLDLHIDKAKNNLRVALSHLKSLLNQKASADQFLQVDREHIRLHGRFSCDLVDLMESLDRILNEQDESIKLAVGKKLLSEIPSTILPGFYDEWALDLRGQLEDQIVELCVWIADACERQGALSEGIAYLNIALRYHSNNAEIYHRILELYKRNKLGTLA